jgi:hypothetical protein
MIIAGRGDGAALKIVFLTVFGCIGQYVVLSLRMRRRNV